VKRYAARFAELAAAGRGDKDLDHVRRLTAEGAK